MGLGGEGNEGEKPLLPGVVWEEAVVVLVVCLAAGREVLAASRASSPKPPQSDQLLAIFLLCSRPSEAVDFRGGDSMHSDPGCYLGLFLPWSGTVR